MIYYLTSHINFPFSINFIYLFFFLFLNFSIPLYISSKFELKLIIPIKIIIVNLIFFLIYFLFANINGTDGLSFYRTEQMAELKTFNNCGGAKGCVRESLILELTSVLKELKINYLNSILLLNIFSVISFLLYYVKVKNFYIFSNFNFFLLFFCAINSGILFWGNGFLKDNFILLAISIFLFSINKQDINYKLLLIALLICFLIRPLPGFFMLLSVVSYLNIHFFLYDKKKLIKINKFLLPIILTAIFFTFKQYNIPFNFDFAHEIIKKINIISGSYADTAYRSGELTYNPTELNYITKIIYYYFLPLKISYNPLYLFLTAQNLSILLVFSVFLLLVLKYFKLFKRFVIELKYQNIFFIYVILYNLVVPLTSYNFGVALRQKWMCLIIITYLFVYFISFVLKKKNSGKNNQTD